MQTPADARSQFRPPNTPGAVDFLGWDVPAWAPALTYWDRVLARRPIAPEETGLELGARGGGLSLYLASRRGVHMVCTDLKNPEQWARPRHEVFSFDHLVRYEAANALELPYADNSFEFVTFKSLLGEVGTVGREQNKVTLLSEAYRVLKPGGLVLFAENMAASKLHSLARRMFRSWGQKWGYTSVPEMTRLFERFTEFHCETTGFLVAFAPPRWKRAVRQVDSKLDRYLPQNSRYVIYGSARKPL